MKERKEFFKAPLAMDGYDDPVPAVGGNAIGLPLSRDTYNAMVLLEPDEKDKTLVLCLKEFRGDAPEPVTVKLEPCGSASGRIVDGDGQPLVGFKFGLGGWGGSQHATTDKDGRFRVEGLIPGMSHELIPSTG